MSRLRTIANSTLITGTLLIWTAGAATAAGPSQPTWAALDPGDDWAAQVLRSIFPTTSTGTSLSGIGAERSVIGQIIGQLTGYILASQPFTSLTQPSFKFIGPPRRVKS